MTENLENNAVSDEFNRLARSEIVLNGMLADHPSGLVFDVTKYLGYAEGMDLSEKEAQDYLAAVWQIVVAFVDLGFGMHPAQQAMDKSNIPELTEGRDVVSSQSVNSENNKTESVGREGATREERIHGPR